MGRTFLDVFATADCRAYCPRPRVARRRAGCRARGTCTRRCTWGCHGCSRFAAPRCRRRRDTLCRQCWSSSDASPGNIVLIFRRRRTCSRRIGGAPDPVRRGDPGNENYFICWQHYIRY